MVQRYPKSQNFSTADLVIELKHRLQLSVDLLFVQIRKMQYYIIDEYENGSLSLRYVASHIIYSRNRYITADGYTSVLTLLSVSEKQAATYECVADNGVGQSATSRATLTVYNEGQGLFITYNYEWLVCALGEYVLV